MGKRVDGSASTVTMDGDMLVELSTSKPQQVTPRRCRDSNIAAAVAAIPLADARVHPVTRAAPDSDRRWAAVSRQMDRVSNQSPGFAHADSKRDKRGPAA